MTSEGKGLFLRLVFPAGLQENAGFGTATSHSNRMVLSSCYERQGPQSTAPAKS